MSDGPAVSPRVFVQEQIAQILARKKKPIDAARVVEGVSLTRDLGIDSLDILQLSAVVEKKFGLRFPEQDLKKMDDLAGILAAIDRARAAKG